MALSFLRTAALGILLFGSLPSLLADEKSAPSNELEKEYQRAWEYLLVPKNGRTDLPPKPLDTRPIEIDIKDVKLTRKGLPKRPDWFPTLKDGNFWRDGKPVFLLGSESAGLQYPAVQRLLGMDADSMDDIWPERFARFVQKDGRWSVSWPSADPYLGIQLKQMLSSHILPYIEFDESEGSRGHPLKDVYPQLFPEQNHYMTYNVLNPVGDRLRWNNRFSAIEQLHQYPIFACELFNEVYYRSHDLYNLEIFRAEMKKKYGTIEHANTAWATDFASFETVLPPNPGHGSGFSVSLPKGYSPALRLDFIKIEEKIFGDYLTRSYQMLKKLAPEYNVTVQSHSSLPWNYGDHGVNPLYAVKAQDFYGGECGFSLYYQDGKEDLDEMNYSLKGPLAYDVVSFISRDRPAVNEENHLTGRGIPKPSYSTVLDFAGSMKFCDAASPDEGEKNHWNEAAFDDRQWKEITVPGLWGQQGWRKTTTGWYRKTFQIPAPLQGTLEKEGSRLYIQGMELTDSAQIYINGALVYATRAWNETFSIDATANIHFGASNTIAIKITNGHLDSGMYWGGIRKYLRLVSAMPHPKGGPGVNPGQMRSYLWTQVVHGYSGSWLFYFASNEINGFFNPEATQREALKMLPRVKNEINALGEIVLPRPRIKGRVALVYPFETLRANVPEDFREFIKGPLVTELAGYYGGLLFSGIPTDIISSDEVLNGDPNRYEAIVFAGYRRTPPGVVEKLKAYLNSGGTLIATHSSFQLDDDFGKPLSTQWMGKASQETAAYEAFDAGKGKIYRLKEELDLSNARPVLAGLLTARKIEPGFTITGTGGQPAPFVEAHAFGKEGRYVWYFLNWGSSLSARVAPGQLPTPLKGKQFAVRDTATGEPVASPSGAKLWQRGELEHGFALELECQNPKILLIEEAELPPTEFPPLKQEAELAKLWRATPRDAGTRVLYHTTYYERMPASKTPAAVGLLEKNGFGVYTLLSGLESRDLKVFDGAEVHDLEKLESYKILVFACPQGNRGKQITGQQLQRIKTFVENGGGLLLLGQLPHGPHGWLGSKGLAALAEPYGITQTYGATFQDKVSNDGGEPLLVRFTQIQPHSITRGVKSFQSAGSGVLELKNSKAKALIQANSTTSPAGKAVLAAVEYGKGRVVVMGDGYWLEGDTLKKGDNQKLLLNLFRWLSGAGNSDEAAP